MVNKASVFLCACRLDFCHQDTKTLGVPLESYNACGMKLHVFAPSWQNANNKDALAPLHLCG